MRLFSLAPYLSKQTLSLQETRRPESVLINIFLDTFSLQLRGAPVRSRQMRNGVKRPLISDRFEGGGRGHGSTVCSERSALPLLSASRNDSVEKSPTQSAWSDQHDSALEMLIMP